MGDFKDNKPHGKGRWYLKNGNQIAGNYKQTVTPNEDPEDTRVNIKLDWQAGVGLADSAVHINKHEQF